jgi:hypothetical protein
MAPVGDSRIHIDQGFIITNNLVNNLLFCGTLCIAKEAAKVKQEQASTQFFVFECN